MQDFTFQGPEGPRTGYLKIWRVTNALSDNPTFTEVGSETIHGTTLTQLLMTAPKVVEHHLASGLERPDGYELPILVFSGAEFGFPNTEPLLTSYDPAYFVANQAKLIAFIRNGVPEIKVFQITGAFNVNPTITPISLSDLPASHATAIQDQAVYYLAINIGVRKISVLIFQGTEFGAPDELFVRIGPTPEEYLADQLGYNIRMLHQAVMKGSPTDLLGILRRVRDLAKVQAQRIKR